MAQKEVDDIIVGVIGELVVMISATDKKFESRVKDFVGKDERTGARGIDFSEKGRVDEDFGLCVDTGGRNISPGRDNGLMEKVGIKGEAARQVGACSIDEGAKFLERCSNRGGFSHG